LNEHEREPTVNFYVDLAHKIPVSMKMIDRNNVTVLISTDKNFHLTVPNVRSGTQFIFEGENELIMISDGRDSPTLSK
jgi:hypothetical protein